MPQPRRARAAAGAKREQALRSNPGGAAYASGPVCTNPMIDRLPGTHRAMAIVAFACTPILFGCGTQQVYHDEAFRPETPFSKRIRGPAEVVCDSVKRTMLNQGYALEAESDTLVATKAFQRDEAMVLLRLRASCLRNDDESHTIYASAVEETSELQTLKQPAGVTVGGVFGLTLPAGSGKIPITVRRETVQDADFYARFYKHVEDLVARALKR